MNAQVKTEVVVSKTTTALAIVTQSIAEINSFEQGIAELEAKYGKLVFDVKTPKGMKEAKEARQEIRKPRYALQKLETDAKRPLNGLKDAISAQTAAMVSRVAAIEDPLHEAITNEEDRIHNEAVAKAAAESARVKALEDRLEAIRLMPYDANGMSSEVCRAALKEAQAIKIGEDWQEFKEKAQGALVGTVAALEGMVAKAVAAEAEQARLVAERAELEKLRAEQAKRDAEARKAQEAEAARIANEQRVESARLIAEKAELDRIERERAAASRAEQDKLLKERQEFEAEQAAARAKASAEQDARIAKDQEAFRAHFAREAAKPQPEPMPIVDAFDIHLDIHTEKALDSLDAAVFSGDGFHSDEGIRRFEWFIARWQREIESIKQMLAEA